MKKVILLIITFGFSTILLAQTYHPSTPNPPGDMESLTHIGDNGTVVVTGNGTWYSNVYSTDETDIKEPWTDVWETVFGQSTADQQGRYLFGAGAQLSILDAMDIPDKFMINNAYPNPFNPSTTIEYGLPIKLSDQRVSISIYDISGRLVNTLVNRQQAAGWHRIVWNGKNTFGSQVSSGVYLVRVIAGTEVKLIKVMFLR